MGNEIYPGNQLTKILILDHFIVVNSLNLIIEMKYWIHHIKTEGAIFLYIFLSFWLNNTRKLHNEKIHKAKCIK